MGEVPPSTVPIIIVGVAVGVAVRVAVAVAVAVAVGVRDGAMVKVGVKLGVAVFLVVVVEQEEHGSHPVPTNRVAIAKNRQMASPAHREIIFGLLPSSTRSRPSSFPPITPRDANLFYSAIKVTKPAAIVLFRVCPVQESFGDRLERRSEPPALREDRQMPGEWQTGWPMADRLVRRLTALRPHTTVGKTAL